LAGSAVGGHEGMVLSSDMTAYGNKFLIDDR